MAYTKLFSSIVTSTIWLEPDETRIVWITMLALADKNGEVQASIPGLARIAGVSVEACRKAVDAFLSPDPDSRTKDEEGRRIEPIEGGWSLINHAKYRRMASLDESKEKNRERQARFRERSTRNGGVTKRNESVTQANVSVTHSTDIAEAEEQKHKAEAKNTEPPNPQRGNDEFDQFWQAYPRRVGKGAAEKAFEKLKCKAILPEILTAIRKAKVSPDWTKDAGQFIPHPATWLNRRGWEDELLPINGPHVIADKDFSDWQSSEWITGIKTPTSPTP